MQIIGQHNWIAIFVFAILWVIFESIWYSPKVFGKFWMEDLLCKHDKDKIKNEEAKCCSANCWIGAFILAFLTVFALSFFDRMTGSHTFADGALNGFIAWLGFAATTHFQSVVWENRSLTSFYIHAGFKLIAFVVIGGLLAIW